MWCKKTIDIWNVDVNNIVISKLIETKTNSKYFVEYLDDVIKPLVLIFFKISGYILKLLKLNIKTINWCLSV